VTKILITGTPATGKTTFALKLSLFFYFNYFNINTLAYYLNAFEYYDKKRDSKVVNLSKLKSLIKKLINSDLSIIFDSHILDCFPSNIDYVIILRCEPLELARRLKLKNYPESKIKENVEAEFLGILSYESHLKFKKSKIIELDNTNRRKIPLNLILLIKGELKSKKYKRIEWQDIYEAKNRLLDFINFQLSNSK
jgi:Predicted nucleotide kinase (related to CMP and AMP kinases)